MKISIVTLVLLIVGLGSFAQPFSIDSSFVSHFDFRSQNSPKVYDIFENITGRIFIAGDFRFNNSQSHHNGIVSYNRNGSLFAGYTASSINGSVGYFNYFSDSVHYLGTAAGAGRFVNGTGQSLNQTWTTNVITSAPCAVGRVFFFADGSCLFPAGVPAGDPPCDVFLPPDTFPGNYLLKIQPNGLWDSTFNPSLSGSPWSVVEYDSNRLFLTGYPAKMKFYENSLVNGLCRIYKDGTLDTTFQSPIKDTAFQINTFNIKKIESDGSLFLVGAFYLKGYSQRFSLVKIHSNGSIDHSFMNLNGPTDTLYNLNAVNTIVETMDGGYLVGGAFNEYQGYPRRNLAKIDSVGKVDSLYFNGLGPDSSAANGTLISGVYSIVKSKFGGYYIGGDFLRHNGLPSQPIYRIFDLQNGVGIKEPSLSSRSQKIYPNPASNQVQLNFQVKPNENVSFLLYSLEGKLMKEEQLRVGNVHAIQLEQLHKGIYIYQLKNDFGEFLNGKLIIN